MTGPSGTVPSPSVGRVAPPPSAGDSHLTADRRFPYATRARRFVAGVIDFVVVNVITLVIEFPLWGYHRTLTSGKGSASHQAIVNLIATAIGLLYYAWPHARWGQTLGKRALNIRVVRSADGGPISKGQAASRYLFQALFFTAANLAAAIATPLSFIGSLNFAWILWDPRRQALQDKAARTLVVGAGPVKPNSPWQ